MKIKNVVAWALIFCMIGSIVIAVPPSFVVEKFVFKKIIRNDADWLIVDNCDAEVCGLVNETTQEEYCIQNCTRHYDMKQEPKQRQFNRIKHKYLEFNDTLGVRSVPYSMKVSNYEFVKWKFPQGDRSIEGCLDYEIRKWVCFEWSQE